MLQSALMRASSVLTAAVCGRLSAVTGWKTAWTLRTSFDVATAARRSLTALTVSASPPPRTVTEQRSVTMAQTNQTRVVSGHAIKYTSLISM